MKETSYGCIVIVGNQFLIGRSSWKKKFGWDIPKGRGNPGESPLEAAERELYEETNIKLNVTKTTLPELGLTIDLGRNEYYSKKDLYLFAIYVKEKPTDIQCNSFFDMAGQKVPEFLEFKWVTLEEAKDYVYPSLYKVLENLKDKLNLSEIV